MSGTVGQQLRGGMLYTALAKYSRVLLSLGVTVVLARLLTPEEFGVVAIVLVFTGFFSLLSDFGIGPAIVQYQRLQAIDISSIFLLTLFIGLVLSGLFFLSAPVLGYLYRDPALTAVGRWIALTVIFYAASVVPKALAQKQLRFKAIGGITFGVQLISGGAAIVAAFAGWSYYALVLKAIVESVLTFGAFFGLVRFPVFRRYDATAFRRIRRFSGYQFLFNFINYFSRNSDSLLIGRYFGAASLGLYDRGYRLMMLPVSNLTHVITPVVQPVFAKYQHDLSFVYRSYLQLVRLLAVIGFPLAIYLYFSAEEIVLLLYGAQWTASVPVFQLLALTVGLQMVMSSSGAIFQIANRTDLLFLSGTLSAFTTVAAILYGVLFGESIEAVGGCLIISFTLNFVQVFYLLLCRVLHEPVRTFLAMLRPAALAGLVLWVLLYGFSQWPSLSIYQRFIGKSFLGAAVVGVFLLRIGKPHFSPPDTALAQAVDHSPKIPSHGT